MTEKTRERLIIAAAVVWGAIGVVVVFLTWLYAPEVDIR